MSHILLSYQLENLISPLDQIAAAARYDQSELTMSVLMTPDISEFFRKCAWWHHFETVRPKWHMRVQVVFQEVMWQALSVNRVNFKEPIHVGELVTFLAKA